jgi:protein-S-isoprenylcysteine O-methyltransferase Ste14
MIADRPPTAEGGGVEDATSGRPVQETTLQLGQLKLTGWSAVAALLLIIGGIVALIVRAHPTRASLPLFTSAALWLVFVIYWSAAARTAGKAERTESRDSRRLHERMLNAGLLLLFIPVPGLRGRFLPAGIMIVVIGLTVQLLSGMLGIWARRHLGRNWSGAVSAVAGHELVRSGPYRVVRHPIYTAMLGMFVGTAVVSGEWHALVAVAIVAVAYWRKIRLEEQHLRQLFGPAYNEYQRSSWSLIPGIF